MSEVFTKIAQRIVENKDKLFLETNKALPTITPLTQPFWEAAKDHRLTVQACQECGLHLWYPKPWCTECGSRDLKWKDVDGKGKVYSFTIIRQVVQNSLAFESDLPFVLAIIELDQGPRFIAPLTGVKLEEVKIGMRVKVTFPDTAGDICLPKFEPDRRSKQE